MTIITKPISEKKIDKLEIPLVTNDQLEDVTSKSDVEAPAPVDAARFVVLRARARRVSTTTTLCLLITSLIVVSIGIVGGTYLYRHYAASMQVHHLWCRIPYKNKENTLYAPLSDSNTQAMMGDVDQYQVAKEGNSLNHMEYPKQDEYWMEEFELDLQNENYERIDVPDFRDGRRGRFIHDFNSNITGIIDIDDRRCFVMPLNRRAVLPPRSLFDLIHKIWEGYYKVNTEVVRETMRVVTPPITDMQSVGTYIARECKFLPVYKLEKYVSPVFKRSADLQNGAKFAQFSGKSIIEFDIVNLGEAIQFEKNVAELQR